ncbi:MAG: tripartite tricarboxylate transporter substrate binding protein [Burkholderiaceae bacterium]
MRALLGCIVALGMLAAASAARADGYPSKPVRIVVIVAPGGAADAMARIIADGLTSRLGQPVIVENKPGAGGNLATQFVARAPADGHTLLLTTNNHTINPSLFGNAGYAVDDFAPVAELFEGPSVIAVPASSRFNTLKELLDEARKSPGSIAYASSGVGLTPHVAAEVLQRSAGVRLNHVAYRGSGPSVTDAVGGQIPVVVASLLAALPFIENGKLKALAVTSPERWPTSPAIPTVAEFGLPGYEQMIWMGLFSPKGTPAGIVRRLNTEVRSILSDEGIKARVAKLGGMVSDKSVEAFESKIRDDHQASTRLVREANLKIE